MGQAGGKERPTGQVAAVGSLKHLLAQRYRHAGVHAGGGGHRSIGSSSSNGNIPRISIGSSSHRSIGSRHPVECGGGRRSRRSRSSGSSSSSSSSSGNLLESGGGPQLLHLGACRGGKRGRGFRRAQDEGQPLGDLGERGPSVGVRVQAAPCQVYVVHVNGVPDSAALRDEEGEGGVVHPLPIPPEVGVLAGIEHPHEDTERKDVGAGRDLHACARWGGWRAREVVCVGGGVGARV